MHVPVMLKEVLQALAVQPGGRYIDATLGGGGHAREILKKSSPGGQLLGIDADPAAVSLASRRLARYEDATLLVNDKFVNLRDICTRYDFFPVHGILLDLGLSSMQLEASGRGFSFQHDAPLDMRFSPEQEISAAEIVNGYSAQDLGRLIREYGEEPRARRIAERIVARRPLKTTLELADVVAAAVGGRHGRTHPATRTFQALRIAVNQELEQLESVLHQAVDLLGFEGRLVVISYHSLEDRIVKRFMQREAKDCVCPPEAPACVCEHRASLKLVSRKALKPTAEEVSDNPRSRSARLRVAERVLEQENSFADYLNLFAETDPGSVWRRPVMMAKLRKTFVAMQTGILAS
jgi:16S rRNA (cytosine1402-N4)-methyltransferase